MHYMTVEQHMEQMSHYLDHVFYPHTIIKEWNGTKPPSDLGDRESGPPSTSLSPIETLQNFWKNCSQEEY